MISLTCSGQGRSLPLSHLSMRWFRRLSRVASHLAGTPGAFLLTVMGVVAWLAVGPAFQFSDKWLLAISTATSILTFLMVVLIQGTQNRDTHAVQLKLDELIRSTTDARNFFVRLEGLPDEAIKEIQAEFDALRQRALRRSRDKPELERKGGG
jgi:low affinity Fe/Cu permease